MHSNHTGFGESRPAKRARLQDFNQRRLGPASDEFAGVTKALLEQARNRPEKRRLLKDQGPLEKPEPKRWARREASKDKGGQRAGLCAAHPKHIPRPC